MIELLIKHGADPNQLDVNGNTPLHNCALKGYEKNAETLIKNGAKANTLNRNNETPLYSAVKNKSISKNFFEILIKNGANPNFSRKDGANLLNLAVMIGNLEFCVKNFTMKSEYLFFLFILF